MSENQLNYQQDMVEVNLKDLFFSVLLHWKKILIVALIVALLISGYIGVKGLSEFSDRDASSEKRAEYQRLVDDYERNVAQIQKKIDDIESELVRQEKYRETSLMLLIDPYDVHTEKFSYYVDTNYEIAPSQYYQNPDYTDTIANAYAAEIDGIDYDDVISEASGKALTTHNPVSGSNLKLVTTAVKPDTGIVEVTIYGDTDEQLDLLRKAITEAIQTRKADFDRLIGTHNLELLSDTRKVSVNKDFVALRDTFNTNFETLSTNLETTKDSLSELEMPVNNVPSRRNIAKRVIKYFVLGGIAGLLMMACAIAVYLIGANALINPEDLSRRHGIPVLGTFAITDQGPLNKLVQKWMGITESAEAGEYIASSLKLRTQGKAYDKVLLTGTASDEDIDKLRIAMEQVLKDTPVVVAGNVNKSPKALSELKGENIAVVCVEKCWESSSDAISGGVQLIKATNHDIVGAVVLV